MADLKVGHYTRKEKAPAADGRRYNSVGNVASGAWLETRKETPLYAYRGGS